jgi:hypothetical protein
MNVRECAAFGGLKCKPDIDLDFDTKACLSRPIWVGQRIEGRVLQEVISPNNVFNLTQRTSRFAGQNSVRRHGGTSMRVVAVLLMLIPCIMLGPAWAGGAHISVGVGGGVDASTYSSDELVSDGFFAVSPALAGFVAWAGSYPRVYRLGAQWTRLHRQRRCICFGEASGGSSCCSSEALDLAAMQLGVLWFEQSTGRRQGYGGFSAGVHRIRSEDNPTEWSPILSVVFGTRLRARGWSVLIEGGGELVIGGDTGFGVVPIRMFLGF